jgi:hypothetical protein
MGRAVARIRANHRCLMQCRMRGDCYCRFNVAPRSGVETSTCYWYQSQFWERRRWQLWPL